MRQMMTAIVLVMVASTSIAQPAANQRRSSGPLAPELTGLGTWQTSVTTAVPAAQRFFDQGLRLLYAFNHAEAIRAFREAARLDPTLAMAYWGEAVARGPNLNAPMSAESGRLAYAAISKARSRAAAATAREQALIDALVRRYAADGAGNRAALDRAYAAAMQKVADRFPDDPDVLTLFADAQMNTMPWDYWQKDGSPKPDTSRVLAALEHAIAKHAEHPGALHYHIHLLEASADPDRAVASADRLGALMPAAGHMVHMPAHIYIRVGRYADAAAANVRAIAADEDYLAQCQAQGLYPVSYYPHNLHFLWAAATLEGRREAAVDAARRVAQKVPHHHAGAVAWTADYPVTPMLAYARFGLWREMLTEPKPPASAPYAIGIWHYARGLAFVARRDLDRARVELDAVNQMLQHKAFATTLKDLPLLTNLRIAGRMLEGELAFREGSRDRAVALLKEAVTFEDAIPYNEPPVWHHPPRQVLGAVLLEASRPQEAETVYREDLQRFRENGWSLFGLMKSLEAQGRSGEAAEVKQRFDRAWSRADIVLTSSRIMDAVSPGPPPASSAGAPHDHHRVHPASEKYADLPDGTRLAYVEGGSVTGTPVVLLHGYTDSWRSYARVLPQLPGHLRVFALTQRGHGTSSKPVHGYDPRHFARDLAAFMDIAGLERAVIVGHSFGATVAQRFALDFPQRVLGLVLEGAFLPRPGNVAVGELWDEVAKFGKEVDPSFVREFQRSTLARPVPDEFFDTVVGESLKMPAHIWKAVLDPFRSTDFATDLAAIRAPTLIVWGDRDAFTGKVEQAALQGAIAGSRLEIYSGTGHSPHWEEPERYASRLASFVGQIARR